MSGFAALMALSASKTKASQNAVESAILQRKRNEELRQRKREEAERKNREMEQKLRLKHFEDQKREQERQLRLQEEAHQRELLCQRREEEHRDALRYGPKKAKAVAAHSAASANDDGDAPRWPVSNVHAQRNRRNNDNGGDHDRSNALTREEKRERKLFSGLKDHRRGVSGVVRRSAHASSSSRHKLDHTLPGGALDMTTSQDIPATPTPTEYRSVKERIAAQPMTLTKLNVVKRDTRTIDEILQDRARARESKVLDGDEAREFSDWFGKDRKKERAKRVAATSASTPTPTSGTDTPPSMQPPPSKNSITVTTPLVKMSATKQSRQLASSSSVPKQSTSGAYTKTAAKSSLPNGSTSNSTIKPKSTPASSSAVNGRINVKKRHRSPSLSESPPPSKRSAPEPRNDIRAEIWKMFGKDRTRYMQDDIFSDDDDMEVGATLLEKEERISARLALKEDQEALEEERRHEEEKRRRRKEKERRV